jgi:hypothetical protein
MEEKYLKYVNQFNDGDFDSLLPFFNTMENILKFFYKKNLLQYVDPFDSELENYQTEILNYLLNNLNDKSTIKHIVSQLSDVEVKDDGYYLQLSDKSDLSGLFKDYSRETSPRDVVKALFNDDNWEHFSNTTDDIYDDVIEVLTPENIELLKTHILDTLTNLKIEIDDETPELFNNYADDEDIFYITPENVGDVIGDKESFMYLLENDYLPDVTGDLHSIHYNAYNQAYESEIYDDVMSELSTFFDVTTSKWITVPSSVNLEKLREFYEIKFKPNEVVNSIKKYVADKNNWGYYSYNIDYIGSWLTLMNSLMDDGEEEWLDFRLSDYADGRLVNRYINEMFGDYI